MQQLVTISSINKDKSLWVRVAPDYNVSQKMVEHVQQGGQLPPVVLFGTVQASWIGDGWYRVDAAVRRGEINIMADLRPGNRDDALVYALRWRGNHRKEYRKVDAARCYRLAVTEFPRVSITELSRMTGLHSAGLNDYRKALIRAAHEPAAGEGGSTQAVVRTPEKVSTPEKEEKKNKRYRGEAEAWPKMRGLGRTVEQALFDMSRLCVDKQSQVSARSLCEKFSRQFMALAKEIMQH